MPYIYPHMRKTMKNIVKHATHPYLQQCKKGVINYLITKILINWIKEISYDTVNDAIGILECVKLELYRRVAAPYEDIMKEENGDVYGPDDEETH